MLKVNLGAGKSPCFWGAMDPRQVVQGFPGRQVSCLGGHTGTPLGLFYLLTLVLRPKDSGFGVRKPGVWPDDGDEHEDNDMMVVVLRTVKIAVIYQLHLILMTPLQHRHYHIFIDGRFNAQRG